MQRESTALQKVLGVYLPPANWNAKIEGAVVVVVGAVWFWPLCKI